MDFIIKITSVWIAFTIGLFTCWKHSQSLTIFCLFCDDLKGNYRHVGSRGILFDTPTMIQRVFADSWTHLQVCSSTLSSSTLKEATKCKSSMIRRSWILAPKAKWHASNGNKRTGTGFKMAKKASVLFTLLQDDVTWCIMKKMKKESLLYIILV